MTDTGILVAIAGLWHNHTKYVVFRRLRVNEGIPTMSGSIDRLIGWLKWPSAVAALLALPGSAGALLALLKRVLGHPVPVFPFLGGMVIYFLLWRFYRRRPIFGSFFSTFEHELTHAVFAWLTFHKVVGMRATWRRGGEVTIEGRGNWLITIAPYFFPTLCLLLGLLLALLPAEHLVWVNALMGATLAYHVISTRRETHSGQPDLRKVGLAFAWMFLPAANIIALGGVLAFSHGGLDGLGVFLGDIVSKTQGLIAGVLG